MGVMTTASRPRRMATAALAVTAMLSVSACGGGSDSAGQADDTFDVLVVGSKSGPLAQVLAPVYASMEGCVKLINDTGGVKGKKMVLDVKDDAGDPTKTVSAVKAALSSKKYDAAVPGMISATVVPAAPLTTQYKVFSMAHAATDTLNDPTKFPYMFGAVRLYSQSMPVLVDTVLQEGHKNAALVLPDNESGHSAEAAFATAAKSKSLAFTSLFIDVAATDATAQLEKLRATGADVLVADAQGPWATALLKGRTKIGWDVPFIGGPVFSDQKIGRNLSEAERQNAQFLTALYNIKDSKAQQAPGFPKFLDAFEKQNGKPLEDPVENPVTICHSLILMRAAADKAKSWSAEDITAAMLTLTPDDVPLWFGPRPFDLSADNHYVKYTTADLQLVPVQPLDHGMYSLNP